MVRKVRSDCSVGTFEPWINRLSEWLLYGRMIAVIKAKRISI